LTNDRFEKEKIRLTPEEGFDLVGIDYFADSDNQLYLVEHFEMYQDALNAKKERKNSDDYFILYKGSGGEYLCR
jgi:hypothetical protein